MKHSSNQQGFTLIELIVVIVILGILAATALPRFTDFQKDAADGVLDAVGGAMLSASSINYANFLINSAGASVIAIKTTATATTCQAVLDLVTVSTTDITTTGNVAGCTAPGSATGSCTLKHSKGTTAGKAITGITCTAA